MHGGSYNYYILDNSFSNRSGDAQNNKYLSVYAAEQIVVQANLHAVPLIFLFIDTTYNTFSYHIRHVSVLIVTVLLYLTINMGTFVDR